MFMLTSGKIHIKHLWLMHKEKNP